MINLFFAAQCDTTSPDSLLNSSNLPKTCSEPETLNTAFMMIFILIGAVAILLIVINGVRYITAGGDPQKVAAAKSGIFHTLIGMVVAGMGAAIVNYVVGLF